jgi:ABC-type spermidine/putrescine transport system permease subunit II
LSFGRVRSPARLAAVLPWLGVATFAAFVLAFVVAPTLVLLTQSVSGEEGLTLAHLAALEDYRYRVAFENSVILSAAVGLVGGGLLAYLVLKPGAPAPLRSAVTSFGAVAANFAGVPLAFAFIATLGTLGLLTAWLNLPYAYRSLDAGLQSLDVRTLVEAAQNLGTGWGRILGQVLLPNLAPALSILSFAITWSAMLGVLQTGRRGTAQLGATR